MMQSPIFSDSLNKTIVMVIVLAFIVAVFGCGGSGGGGGGGSSVTSENVTISGTIDDGTSNSPIGNAECT